MSEEDDPMPSAVRQRRLPLIGSIPTGGFLYSIHAQQLPNCSSYNPNPVSYNPNPASYNPSPTVYATPVNYASPRSLAGYYTPREAGDYYEESASEFEERREYDDGRDYGERREYRDAREASPARNSRPTYVYAARREPTGRLIQAQPAAMPFSDSDTEVEQRWN